MRRGTKTKEKGGAISRSEECTEKEEKEVICGMWFVESLSREASGIVIVLESIIKD